LISYLGLRDLLGVGFYTDNNGNVLSDRNNGHKKRKAFISKSKDVEFIDRLKLDLASQHRYILNDTNVSLSLSRLPDQFCLTNLRPGSSTDAEINPKIKILDACLFMRKHTLCPSLVKAHQKLLKTGSTAVYR